MSPRRMQPRPRGARLAALALGIAFAALAPACGEGTESVAAREFPAGTVLTIDGRPVLEADVDAIAERLAEVRPGTSLPHLRRLALVRVLFPRYAARRQDEEGWSRARDMATQGAPSQLSAGPFPGAESSVLEGSWHRLGLHLGPVAFGMQEGEWRGPIEEPGAFVHLRLEERVPGPTPLEDLLRVQVVRYRFLDVGGEVESTQAAEDSALEIIDPAWREIVPEYWQRAMTEVE